MGHGGSGFGQKRPVGRVQGNAVGKQRTRTEHPEPVQVGDDPCAVGFDAIIIFPGRLSGVGGEQEAALPGKGGAAFQGGLTAGVDGVGENGWPKECRAGQPVSQGRSRGQGGVGRLEAGVFDVENTLAKHGPQSGLLGGVGHGVDKQVGVEKAGRS